MTEALLKMPASPDAEKAILGAILLDPAIYPEVAAEIGATDFFTPSHGLIFATMGKLLSQGQAVDPVTVTESLMADGTLDRVGGPAYLAGLWEQAIPGNFQSYVNIVRGKSLLRQIIRVCHLGASRAMSTDDTPADELTRIQKEILAIQDTAQKQNWLTLQEASLAAWQELEARQASGRPIAGIATGLTDLDWTLSGLHRGNLTIVAARPSMGKTAFAQCIAEGVANSSLNQTSRIAIFSLEMSATQLAYRELSRRAPVNAQAMRNNAMQRDDWHRVGKAIDRMESAQIAVNDSAYQTPATIQAQLNQFVRQYGGVDLVILDYLQLCASGQKTGSTNDEISKISRAMKLMAKEYNASMMVLSQLSRSCETRTNKRPVLADLRDSGAIEQDADEVLFLYRDHVYNPDADRSDAELIIAKQRNGPTTTIPLHWSPETTRFSGALKQ